MSEPASVDPQTNAQMRANLQELARLLRAASHLEPEAQRSLANLLDELGSELDPAALTSTQMAHLAETVGRVARSLHEKHDPGLLVTARERLQEAVSRAETEAPVATGIVRQFIDLLAGMGI